MTRTPTPHADIREEFARIAETVKPPADRTWTRVAIAAFNAGKDYAAAAIRSARAAVPDVGHPHLIDGEFQSDKYPTTPRNKVPLSTKDKTAQDLLWEYAQRRRAVDAEFATDLEIALTRHGYTAPNRSHPLPSVCGGEVTDAWTRIIAERQRQISEEGWISAHDDEHADGEMMRAAMIYLHWGTDRQGPVIDEETSPRDGVPEGWPWDVKWWKPKSLERNLERAGALMLAERDRLVRAGKYTGHVEQKIGLVLAALASAPQPACVGVGEDPCNALSPAPSPGAGGEIVGQIECRRDANPEKPKQCICCPGFESHVYQTAFVIPYVQARGARQLQGDLDDWLHGLFEFKELDGRQIRITAELLPLSARREG